MTIPFRHLTGQSITWREPGSSPPCSACLEPLVWVAPGACWKERSAWGAENPWTSTRTPSTLTLVVERLEDDESSFEAEVFKGPAEPLGALWREPLNLRCHFVGIGGTPTCLRRTRSELPGGRYRSGSTIRTHIRLSRPMWTF